MKRFLPYIKLVFTKAQTVTIDAIPNGSIIDIGGGGEGIIAQIGEEKVTVIDKHQGEINEARSKSPTSEWVLADATNLEYDTGYFDNATAFFSGMYMTIEVFEKVCKEVYRVLRNNGEFWIWDAKISEYTGLFIIRLSVNHKEEQQILYPMSRQDKHQVVYFHIRKTSNCQQVNLEDLCKPNAFLGLVMQKLSSNFMNRPF